MKIITAKSKKGAVICYTYETLKGDDLKKPSIFLMGPTPRSKDVASWRPEAIKLLEEAGFDGVIYVPEYNKDADLAQKEAGKDWYEKQIEWEHHNLDYCYVILAWVPREMKTMPALTTNVEFGFYVHNNSRVFYGRPDDAPNNKYLDYCYEKFTERKPANNLKSLVKKCMDYLT